MSGKRKWGFALVAAGILTIVVSVIWVLEVANGPGTGPKTFAQRRSYNQTKEAMHEAFPLGFVFGLAGLGVVLYGSRLLRQANEERDATEGQA